MSITDSSPQFKRQVYLLMLNAQEIEIAISLKNDIILFKRSMAERGFRAKRFLMYSIFAYTHAG
jgi:hypothetical protein